MLILDRALIHRTTPGYLPNQHAVTGSLQSTAVCTIGEDLSGANRAKMAFGSFPTAARRAVNNLDAAVRDHVGESIFLFGLDGLFMQYLLAESLDFPTCGERP